MKIFIPLFCFLFALVSCKKFLDVNPESDISKEELFKTPEGFEEALNGVYSRAVQGDIYGNELTFGLLDVLAQDYTISFFDNMAYQQSVQFNYRDGSFISRKDNIWKGLYHAISSCNLILENIDSKKNMLNNEDYSIIKGEALALRAYMHFDLLRMFAPSFVSSPGGKGIPYVTGFTNKVTPMSSVSETVEKIIADLEDAKKILAPVDLIRTADYIVGYPADDEQSEESASSLFMHNRRHRMNYYAVCGELARVYLYMDKKDKALENAQEVIESEKFPWTDSKDFLTSDETMKDRVFYKELIFAWYIPGMQQALLDRFGSGTSSLYIEENAGNTIFEVAGVGAEDIRYKEWLRLAIDVTDRRLEVQKYLRDDDVNRHPLVAPAIRLSEMYYIAAESIFDTDPQKALEYFNTVRFNRGIGTPLSAVATKDDFLRELLKEARKELFGEGQIFYMYKRLNRSIIGQSGISYPASDAVFVFPLPNDEIEFGNR